VRIDAVHGDRAALHADLERRLGGEVLRCLVTDVDYVQGTTQCDVRFRSPAHRSRITLAGTKRLGGVPAQLPTRNGASG
jgi:hypothetical protein